MKRILLVTLLTFGAFFSYELFAQAAPTTQIAPAAQAPVKLPTLVTCKLNKPIMSSGGLISIPIRTDFIAVAADCSATAQQTACDKYKNSPDYGPAVPTACDLPTSKDQLICKLKKEMKTNRFPGVGGRAVLCQTRFGTPKKFAVPVSNCDPQTLQDACDTEAGFADPLSCTPFITDLEFTRFLNDNRKRYGIECQLLSNGTAYRVRVPDCSPAVKDDMCKPNAATVKYCSDFGPDDTVLARWLDQFPDPALITCKENQTGINYMVPARDCNPETLKMACFKGVSTAVDCGSLSIEELKRKAAEKKQQSTQPQGDC